MPGRHDLRGASSKRWNRALNFSVIWAGDSWPFVVPDACVYAPRRKPPQTGQLPGNDQCSGRCPQVAGTVPVASMPGFRPRSQPESSPRRPAWGRIRMPSDHLQRTCSPVARSPRLSVLGDHSPGEEQAPVARLILLRLSVQELLGTTSQNLRRRESDQREQSKSHRGRTGPAPPQYSGVADPRNG